MFFNFRIGDMMFSYEAKPSYKYKCEHIAADTGMKWSFCKQCDVQMVFDTEKGYIEDTRGKPKAASSPDIWKKE